MTKIRVGYNILRIIAIIVLFIVLHLSNNVIAQLDYSLDYSINLEEKAKPEGKGEDFLEQKKIEAEKKQIKKKMKELLGDRDYKNLLDACQRLQQLDPDDKFVDLYKKFAEEGLLKDSVKPKSETSVENVIIEKTPEAVESPTESVKADVNQNKTKNELVTKVETKRPLLNRNKKLIAIGIIGIVILIGMALIVTSGKKKKARRVSEKGHEEELLITGLPSDLLSDIPATSDVNNSELFFPQTEAEQSVSATEAKEEVPIEEEKVETYPTTPEEPERKLPSTEDFKLPAFDEMLPDEPIVGVGSPRPVLDDDETSPPQLTEQPAYESQAPLQEEKPSETTPLARNELPLVIEPLLPISEDKNIVSGAIETKPSAQKMDEPLTRLDEILVEKASPVEELPSLPTESLLDIRKEAEAKMKTGGKDLSAAKIDKDAKAMQAMVSTQKAGSFDDLSIDDLLSGVSESKKEVEKKDDVLGSQPPLSDVDSEKKAEDIGIAQTVFLTPLPESPAEEEGDWVLASKDKEKLSPLDDIKIEEKPIPELVKQDTTNIDKSILTYDEDEDELNIESEVLSPTKIPSKEVKTPEPTVEEKKIQEKKSETETDAVFNEHYIIGCKALVERNWKKAIYEFNIAQAMKPESLEVKEKLNEARNLKAELDNGS